MAIFGLHISRILHENNFWTKKRLFFESSLNNWLSVGWFDFSKKWRSLRKKSQRLLKIWRWLLKIWRAYKNAKRGKIWAKNVHKSRACVQNLAFCALIFHRARVGRGPETPIFHSKLLRRREQNFLWNILTFCMKKYTVSPFLPTSRTEPTNGARMVINVQFAT